MKKIFLFIFLTFLVVVACKSKSETKSPDFIYLIRDSLAVANMTDTLAIAESTCRGCAYEGSTAFSIDDSLGVVELVEVLTEDRNTADVAGGSISKLLLLVPKKKGTTTFRLYKFWSPETRSEDSANAKSYTVEIKE